MADKTDYLEAAKTNLKLSQRGPHDPSPLYAAQALAAAAIVQAEMLRSISVDLNMIVVDLSRLRPPPPG